MSGRSSPKMALSFVPSTRSSPGFAKRKLWDNIMEEDPHRMPATRQSWPDLQPLPDKRAQLVLQRVFTQEEYENISWGFIPEAMEDKWFIFLEGEVLSFYRSWTGYYIYQLTLKKDGEHYAIVDAIANRDPSQYGGTDDGYDESLVMALIDNVLLRRRAPFPRPAGLPAGLATDLHQHHVAGRAQIEEEGPKRRKKRGWLWRWLTGGAGASDA
jgi:hypothetical protein